MRDRAGTARKQRVERRRVARACEKFRFSQGTRKSCRGQRPCAAPFVLGRRRGFGKWKIDGDERRAHLRVFQTFQTDQRMKTVSDEFPLHGNEVFTAFHLPTGAENVADLFAVDEKETAALVNRGAALLARAAADAGEDATWQGHLEAGNRQLETLNAQYEAAKNAEAEARQAYLAAHSAASASGEGAALDVMTEELARKRVHWMQLPGQGIVWKQLRIPSPAC